MREFIIDLSPAETFEGFATAFNEGFCRHVFGEWSGRSWDAFHDYLSWPEEERYRLTFRGWNNCSALRPEEREMILQIIRDNAHVDAQFT